MNHVHELTTWDDPDGAEHTMLFISAELAMESADSALNIFCGENQYPTQGMIVRPWEEGLPLFREAFIPSKIGGPVTVYQMIQQIEVLTEALPS